MRALGALTSGLALLTGAALAAPVAVIEVSDGHGRFVAPLDDGEDFTYSYIQSIYGVTVVEEQRRVGDRLRIIRVRSTDIKAVEYFRWESPIRDEGAEHVQDAPSYEVPQLLIRITPASTQRIATPRWTLDLPGRFGDAAVTVRPETLPRAMVLWLSR